MISVAALSESAAQRPDIRGPTFPDCRAAEFNLLAAIIIYWNSGLAPQKVTACIFKMTGVTNVQKSVTRESFCLAVSDVCLIFDFVAKFTALSPLSQLRDLSRH